MGRDVNGLRIDKKPNAVNGNSRSSIGVAAQVANIGSPGKAGKFEHKLEANDTLTDECSKKQDVQGGIVTNHGPEEKIIDAETRNSIDGKLRSPIRNASVSAVNGMMNGSGLHSDHADGTKINDLAVNIVARPTDSLSPEPAKKLDRNPVTKSYFDEDDNWSLASSTATSVRTAKITVPVAPRFTCLDRLQRRKEFYSKLDEKHRALDKEKLEYEARIKEEEQSAIKLMRKNMSYKANPVPSFYREGPPAKVELKKLPLTHAKSPVFTRRKSCGDAAVKSSPSPTEKVVCGRMTRHSTGATREAKPSPLSSKSKAAQNGCSPIPNGTNKTRIHSQQIAVEMEGKGNANIGVES